MSIKRLSWRIGLPFAAFVLAGSVALVVWMGWNLANEDRARFEMLARTNADFINRVQLPASDRMAEQLRQVIGNSVFFRKERQFTPEPVPLVSTIQLADIPSDGRTHRVGTFDAVAVPLRSGYDLMLVRNAFMSWREVLHPSTFAVLGAFWVLALFVAWLVSRGLVLPLRHLTAKLPEIEKPGELELPEAARKDEIGDVARAFVRTRAALHSEREKRERAEKLAVLGRMTAALAHEIQNPVAAIKMHAQLLQDGREGVDVIVSEAERLEELVNQWMFLSRPEPPAMSPIVLGELIAAALLAHRMQLEHARVESEVCMDDNLVIQGDRRRLAQVFSNLIMNAVQAMPRGGVLKVSGWRVGDTMVEVLFADQGPGFSQTALARCAEFFFSEKEGGMGIGLSVANEIIKAHGGDLNVVNRTGGGACVTVRLPVCVL
ncbi:MAG: hypothetical protein K8R87_10010 [Verrucomicrobia bacterium]|nr:hypothetical protein [Verrucomicrobiota bacterium]